MAALLEVRGLAKSFGGRPALAGLSFAVERGEIFGLLGPNGSGKSTTFGILTGLVAPDAGDCVLDGVPCTPGDRRLRARIGVVFQSPSLDDRLTAKENLAYAARLRSVPRETIPARVAELLAWSELDGRAEEPIKSFSGGMRRRLDLARALVDAPDLLVMDEPTTGLDEASFQRAWERVGRLRAESGLTVLMTTHRAEEAERCDRIAILHKGKLVVCETPAELRARVHGDVLHVEGDDPEGLAAALREALGLGDQIRVEAGRVRVELPRAHEAVPRIVGALPAGRIRSITMRPPGLGDAFLLVTGEALEPARGDA